MRDKCKGNILIAVGLIPFIVWQAIILHLIFVVGPQRGWLTEVFFHEEKVSFGWCMAMIAFTPFGISGGMYLRDRNDGK